MRNTACGNLTTLNHTGLTNSASVSFTPKVALPMSTLILMLAAAGWAGSNATWAPNLRKCPSTGTFICRLTNWMLLSAGTSACCACCASAGAAATKANEVTTKERIAKALNMSILKKG